MSMCNCNQGRLTCTCKTDYLDSCEAAHRLMAPSAPLPVVIKRSFVAPSDFGASNPVVHAEGYTRPEIDTSYSAMRAAFQELLQKTRHEQDEMQDALLLNALQMTRQEAVVNRHRITRHCHPDRDLFLLDGEPVIEIHKPVIRGDELVTSYKILRTMP